MGRSAFTSRLLNRKRTFAQCPMGLCLHLKHLHVGAFDRRQVETCGFSIMGALIQERSGVQNYAIGSERNGDYPFVGAYFHNE